MYHQRLLPSWQPWNRQAQSAWSLSASLPSEPLISVWEHSAKVDIAPTVKEVGFNTVWTHDKPYSGQKLEETLMYKQLLDFFVQDINEGKLCGLRIFRVENLQQRPEYATWAKEALANLKRT
jgi:hypothetical protein